ncbi:MAG: hypothetical protein IIU78_01745 [Alistipes sp.]|nr:hypothetical protein [Alistipes sp.]
MESSRIKILVDSYFEGITTREEEIELANYLASTDNLPTEYASVKMMFEAMGLLRQTQAPKRILERKRKAPWKHLTAGLTVAASILLIIVATTNKTIYTEHTTPAIICHVDGTLVSNQATAEHEARRILGNMNANINLAMASVDKISIISRQVTNN